MTPTEQTTDLAGFLLARIAEDERGARAATRFHEWRAEWRDQDSGPKRWEVASVAEDEWGIPEERMVMVYLGYPFGSERPIAAHIARHDPARVLAECEAKRRIVESRPSIYLVPGPTLGAVHEEVQRQRDYVFRLLALPYSSHPDYDEAWRP